MTAASQMKLTNRQSWKALSTHYESIRDVHLRTLFADDPKRGERFTLEAAGLFLDYSKNRITDETLALLCRLVSECGLASQIEAMFRGDKINITEDRAVLHVALRMPRSESIVVDGKDLVADVHAVLDKMAGFSEQGAQWGVERAHGQTHSQRDQYRYRRLGPGTCDGLRGA
jgi:glucose-6-phosphate isomerase